MLQFLSVLVFMYFSVLEIKDYSKTHKHLNTKTPQNTHFTIKLSCSLSPALRTTTRYNPAGKSAVRIG